MKDGFDKFNVGNKVSLTVVLNPTTNTPEPIVFHRNLLLEIERGELTKFHGKFIIEGSRLGA